MSLHNIPTENLDPWMITWDLEGKTAQILKTYGEELKIPARDTLFNEGEIADDMFLVLKGMVLVLRKDDQGHEHTVSIVVEGQSFGEVSLLVDQARMATVAAGIDSVVLRVTRDALAKIEKDHPDIALDFYRNLAQRFAEQWIEMTRPPASK